MSEQNNPILNSPYTEPKLHYRTLPDGTLDYLHKENSRRIFDPKINAPIPVKSGKQAQMFSNEQVADADNHMFKNKTREIFHKERIKDQ